MHILYVVACVYVLPFQAMFRGQSGSDIENQFEAMLEEAEEAEAKYTATFHIEERIWQNAKVGLKFIIHFI